MTRNLHFEVEYPYPPEQVWQALTQREALALWLMPNDFAPIVGHRFQFHTKPAPGFDGIVQCEVLEVLPPTRLVYTWIGGGVDTTLTWTLKRNVNGTQLMLDHNGFEGLRGLFVSKILGSGWNSRILRKNLPALLERWTGVGPISYAPATTCRKEEEQ